MESLDESAQVPLNKVVLVSNLQYKLRIPNSKSQIPEPTLLCLGYKMLCLCLSVSVSVSVVSSRFESI